ncbi:MAG: MgtC/SapB family protein [Vicinamibacterales bacterium]
MSGLDPLLVRDFGIALLIGALLGIEREMRKARERDVGIGGVRTFILFAELGAVSAWIARTQNSPWVFAVTLLGTSLLILAGYTAQARRNPESVGLTTEMAALSVFLLGGLVIWGSPELAVALAIVNSAVLAFKQPLHALVDRLGTDDLYAVVQLLVATFVVLPLLPDRALDPWGALNPYQLWLLVVLISTLSLIGYVAVRWFGPHTGTALTGIFGGLVSSTAVTLAMSRQSDTEAGRSIPSALAAGILLAWAVMFGRVIVEVAVVAPALLPELLMTVGVMAVTALAMAFGFWWSAGKGQGSARSSDVSLRNPFSMVAAARFALFFAVVLVVVALARRQESSSSVYVVAALAGLTDVDAITLSMAQAARQELAADVAVKAILTAATTNTLVKTALVMTLGSVALRRPVLIGTVAILGAGVITLFVA